MKRWMTECMSEIIYWLARLLVLLPDRLFIAVLSRLRRMIVKRNPKDFRATVLRDVLRIFSNPHSARLARRMVTDARRHQFKALIRGALR